MKSSVQLGSCGTRPLSSAPMRPTRIRIPSVGAYANFRRAGGSGFSRLGRQEEARAHPARLGRDPAGNPPPQSALRGVSRPRAGAHPVHQISAAERSQNGPGDLAGSPVSPQERPERWDYHAYPDRAQARLAVVKRHSQGWDKVSISRVLQGSRPTVDAIRTRFDHEHFAGLADKRRGPEALARAGCLSWGRSTTSRKRIQMPGSFGSGAYSRSRTSRRAPWGIMALNRLVYEAIPQVRRKGSKPPPQPHPFQARRPHAYWLIDGRPMDFPLEGVTWWRLVLLEGSSRTMLAGMVAPAEAPWAALMVLDAACLRYGVPEPLVSEGGGAYTSHAFEAVCQRLALDHRTITRGAGQSWKNLMEPHCNIQRRRYDYQVSLATTPMEFEQRHPAFIQLDTTTAHQGRLKEGCDPPIPLHVLGEAKGRLYAAEDLHRQVVHHLCRRPTNRYGCVALHHSHCHGEAGGRNRPCGYGSRATGCGWPVKAWSWLSTTATTIGGHRGSRTSEARCSTRRGSHRPKGTCCHGASRAGWSSIAPDRLGGGNRTPASRRNCRYSRRAVPHQPAGFPIEVKCILARAADHHRHPPQGTADRHAPPDHRHERPCHAGRPRTMSSRRDGWLHQQAGSCR